MILFSGRSNLPLSQKVADYLGVTLGQANISNFPDGEVKIKLDEDIRGRDVFILQSTCQPVNESLMELLIFIDCARRASAERVTAVIPYFGYARQDRKDEGRTPITAKLAANLIVTPPGQTAFSFWTCMQIRSRVSSIFRWITFWPSPYSAGITPR